MPNSGEFRDRSNFVDYNNSLNVGNTFGYTWTNSQGSGHQGPLVSEHFTSSQTLDYHQMADWVHGFQRNTRRYAVGDCSNTVAHIQGRPLISGFALGPSGGEGEDTVSISFDQEYNTLMPIGRNVLSNISLVGPSAPGNIRHLTTVPDQLVADLNLEAFNYFVEVFPQELSAGEFTQSFTQLRELLPQIKDSLTKTLAGGYVTKEFGWDNLLADLGILSNLIDNVKSRLEYLKNTYGIPTRLGFSRPGVWSLPNSYDFYMREEEIAWYLDLDSRARLIDFKVDYRATAWITQTLDFLDGVMGWFRGISHSIGLDNPVKLFWELLPFSFLIDWFLNVSGHLDALTRARPAVGWDVNSITHSLKYSYKWEIQTIIQAYTEDETLVQKCILEVTRYDRRVDLPFELGLLDPTQLSTPQYAILVALGMMQ